MRHVVGWHMHAGSSATGRILLQALLQWLLLLDLWLLLLLLLLLLLALVVVLLLLLLRAGDRSLLQALLRLGGKAIRGCWWS
jgi:hypothetical protein